LIAIKEPFLATANHYADIGEHGQRFAIFLTYAALAHMEGYTAQDFQTAIDNLPPEGLNEVARAIVQALEAAGEQREEYWENRIKPFLKQIWPKFNDRISNSIAEEFALLAIAARGRFPDALSAVIGWLKPLDNSNYVVSRLHESELTKQCPKDALKLLCKIINDQHDQLWKELGECLNTISQASPEIAQDSQYQHLVEYARQHGVMG